MKAITKAALDWAADGIPVFPCASNKQPLTSNGFYDATTDPQQVKELFELAPDDCKIGARMGSASGLFACDFDIYKPGEAGASAQKYMAQLIADGLLPDTQRHRTMNGGLHLIFQSRHGFPNVKPAEGVEIKGEGGYIILPPSEGYSIEDDNGFREAPKALVEALVRAKRSYTDRTIEQHEQSIIAGKDFHDSIASIAAKMFRRGATASEVSNRIFGALEASVARSSNHPRHQRWSDLVSDSGGEVSRIINSGREKYDAHAKTNEARDSFSAEDIERAKRAAEAAGFSPNREENSYEADPEPTPDDFDGWPFDGEGYFAGEQLEISDQRFNLFPLYAENESVVIAADPKAGKTAISLKLAVHVAAGRDLGSFKVTDQRGVLYYALEGTRAIKLRVEAEKRSQQDEGTPLPDNLPLFVVERPTNFVEKREQNVAKAVAAARYFEEQMGIPLGVIVIDTLTKAMPGADQNSVDDTSALFDFTTQLRSHGVKATVVYIHHTGKDGKTRGSSNIEAEVDVVLKMRKHEDSTTEMYVHMARSIDDNHRYLFELKSYDLGETIQGIRQSAPIVTPVEGNIVADEVSEDAKDAAQRAKYFNVIVRLGDGEYKLRDIIEAWKKASLVKPRVRAATIEEIMDFLFRHGLEQRFRGKTIAAKKVGTSYDTVTIS